MWRRITHGLTSPRRPSVNPPPGTVLLLAICLWSLLSPPASAMMGIEEERKLGEQIVQQIEQQAVLVKDPEVVGYVSRVGRNILQHVRVKFFHYHFYVIKDDALNAFALPGGHIFVHTGLLEAISSENELACVLAHEIGHVQGRHLARRMERMKRVNLVTMTTALLGIFLGKGQAGNAIFAGSAAMGASIALKYSRADEEEADRRAFQWICSSGYNPMGLVTTLKKMQRYHWLGSDQIPSYLLTHPGTSQRITYIEDMYRRHPCNSKKWRGQGEDEALKRIKVKIQVMSGDPMVLIPRYRRRVERDPKDIMALYGLGSALLAAKEYREAIAAFRRVVALRPKNPLYKVDLAKALEAYGRYGEALGLLKPLGPRLSPGGRFVLARALLESGHPREALEILKGLEGRWPDRAGLYFLMARCYGGMKRPGEAHYYFYRHYSLVGNGDAARYHRAMALRQLPRDSRLRERLQQEEDGGGENGAE